MISDRQAHSMASARRNAKTTYLQRENPDRRPAYVMEDHIVYLFLG